MGTDPPPQLAGPARVQLLAAMVDTQAARAVCTNNNWKVLAVVGIRIDRLGYFICTDRGCPVALGDNLRSRAGSKLYWIMANFPGILGGSLFLPGIFSCDSLVYPVLCNPDHGNFHGLSIIFPKIIPPRGNLDEIARIIGRDLDFFPSTSNPLCWLDPQSGCIRDRTGRHLDHLAGGSQEARTS